MQLSPLLLDDVDPTCLVEIGNDSGEPHWVVPVELAEVPVVPLEDRAGLVEHPERLAAVVEDAGSFAVVVDHARDDASAMHLFEVIFGRLAPGGLYVVHGDLPSGVVLDLMLASVVSPAIVDSVAFIDSCVVIRRGGAPVTADRVDVSALRSDPYGIASR